MHTENAALSMVAVFGLIRAQALCAWHLYALNALNGLMNTIRQPAGEIAATLLIPKEYYRCLRQARCLQ